MLLSAAAAGMLGAGVLGFLPAGAAGLALLCGLFALVLAASAALAHALGRVLISVTVRGTSMAPAYRDGDRVLVRRDRPPVTGQVVVVADLPPAGPQMAPAWLIKRVAAVPGDPVPRDLAPVLAHVPEDLVPPGKLVLLGDNQNVSRDSRHMGYFPADAVLGAVLRSHRRPAPPGG